MIEPTLIKQTNGQPKLISIKKLQPSLINIHSFTTQPTIEAEKSLRYKKKFLNKEFKNTILDELFKCLVYTSINGVPFLARTKYRFMKFFWLIVLLTSVSTMGYYLYLTLVNYYSYPLITVTNDYKESPTLFPAITICNINPLATYYASRLLEKKLPPNFNIANDFDSLLNTEENLLIQEFVSSNRTLLGYKISDILITCNYNAKNCFFKDFSPYYSYEYGNCFTFNSGINNNSDPDPSFIKSMFYPGSKNGLYIEMFARTTRNNTGFGEDFGGVLFVHNQTQRPEESEEIRLKTGTKTSIALHKTFIQNYPSPYSACQDLNTYKFNRIIYDAILNSPYSYSQKECFNGCLQQIIINQCGCYDVEYLKLGKSKPCLNESELNCTNIQYLNFIKQDEIELCKDYCPLECNSVSYQASISSAGFPTDVYSDVLINRESVQKHYAYRTNLTIRDIQSEILAVNVYFNDFTYTEISNTPQYAVFDLIGNIGGLTGLFLGGSYLSYIEIFDLIFSLIMVLINKKTIKNKN